MAFHHHSTGHKINFDGTEIIAEEKSYWRRLIIEGLEIKDWVKTGLIGIQVLKYMSVGTQSQKI